jgi:hypothetical protein
VVFLSLFRDIWFHWTGPAFVTLLPLAAVRLAAYNKRSLFPAALKWSTAVFILAMMVWPLMIYFYPGTYGQDGQPMLGKGDVTLDKFGWKISGSYFADSYQHAVAKKIIAPQTPVVCPTWWGAHIEYYFARKAGAPVIGLGDTLRLGQYNWLNKERLPITKLDTALLIEPSIEYGQAGDFYYSYYRKRQLLYTLSVYRNGKEAFNFKVSRLTGWKNKNEDDLLPVLITENR